MKEKLKKAIGYLIKYIPDVSFLIGSLVLSYAILTPVRTGKVLGISNVDEIRNCKIFGIMLIAFAVVITIRRCFAKRGKPK
jgi:uncharacterized membrane protein (DUF441 family)